MSKTELPKSRALWRVTGMLLREGGHWKAEISALMRLGDAQQALVEWKNLGCRDVEVIVDEAAVDVWRKETGRSEDGEPRYNFGDRR